MKRTRGHGRPASQLQAIREAGDVLQLRRPLLPHNSAPAIVESYPGRTGNCQVCRKVRSGCQVPELVGTDGLHDLRVGREYLEHVPVSPVQRFGLSERIPIFSGTAMLAVKRPASRTAMNQPRLRWPEYMQGIDQHTLHTMIIVPTLSRHPFPQVIDLLRSVTAFSWYSDPFFRNAYYP
jgi:hypothetical protein